MLYLLRGIRFSVPASVEKMQEFIFHVKENMQDERVHFKLSYKEENGAIEVFRFTYSPKGLFENEVKREYSIEDFAWRFIPYLQDIVSCEVFVKLPIDCPFNRLFACVPAFARDVMIVIRGGRRDVYFLRNTDINHCISLDNGLY